MMGNKLVYAIVLCSTLLAIGSNSRADMLYFSFSDPVGDHTGNIDVTHMDFTFENNTGDYTILLQATATNPFQGDFRVNINLFNPDIGTTARNPSLFEHNMDDHYSVSPVSTLTLTGTSSRLLSWNIGDRVATTDTPFGNPDNVLGFWSPIGDLPYGSGFDGIADGDSTVITPVPGAALLGILGLSVVGIKLRRRA